METVMPKALWNNVVIAQSDFCKTVEGNAYFPPDALDMRYFKPSQRHTVCPWKGEASYYDVEVDGAVSEGAAWYYPTPKPAASEIVGYVAFWRGVKVIG
jgi:uncharacterized protein (DUF427 family)